MSTSLRLFVNLMKKIIIENGALSLRTNDDGHPPQSCQHHSTPIRFKNSSRFTTIAINGH